MKKIGFLIAFFIMIMSLNNSMTSLKDMTYEKVGQSVEENILIDLPDDSSFEVNW